jgi:hypothetical protein
MSFVNPPAHLKRNLNTEEKGKQRMLPMIQAKCHQYQEITDIEGQHDLGDMKCQLLDGRWINVELKTEEKWTGNLFIERWSNKPTGKVGWAWNLKQRDIILYFFLDSGNGYILSAKKLERYIADGHIASARYVKQHKNKWQKNETWGYLGKITDLIAAGVITREFSA